MLDMSPTLFFCLLGLGLIGVELVVFQLSVVWLLFIGSGALLAAGLGWLLGWQDWTLMTATFVMASAAVTVLLYRPLKRWQNTPGPIAGNDAIGQQVRVVAMITPDAQGKVTWSGTEWPAVLINGADAPLNEGDVAYICAIAGIRLTVSAQAPDAP